MERNHIDLIYYLYKLDKTKWIKLEVPTRSISFKSFQKIQEKCLQKKQNNMLSLVIAK